MRKGKKDETFYTRNPPPSNDKDMEEFPGLRKVHALFPKIHLRKKQWRGSKEIALEKSQKTPVNITQKNRSGKVKTILLKQKAPETPLEKP